MNPKLKERAQRLLADFDADVAVANRKRNGRADAVGMVMAKFGAEATELLRELLRDDEEFNRLFHKTIANREEDHD